MAKQTFVASTVLTAAQMNALQANDYNQTVSTKTASYTLVAADAGTRVVMNSASATTITVNTSLFSAGDTLFLQNIGAGVCTVTAGTATVSSAGSLAIPQNGSGLLYFTSAGVSIFYPSAVTATASGLTFISKTSFSAVSSVSLATSTFTSTYKNYRTIFLLTAASTTLSITLRLRASGTDNSSALYQQMSSGLTQVTANTSNLGQSNATSWDVNGATTSAHYGLILDVLGPQTATSTQIQGQLTCDNNSSYVGRSVNGLHNSTTSFDALSYIASTGNFTGSILVYGYTES